MKRIYQKLKREYIKNYKENISCANGSQLKASQKDLPSIFLWLKLHQIICVIIIIIITITFTISIIKKSFFIIIITAPGRLQNLFAKTFQKWWQCPCHSYLSMHIFRNQYFKCCRFLDWDFDLYNFWRWTTRWNNI